jgi:hypothetical protein
MPNILIGVADSIAHNALDLVSHVDRLVVFDDTVQSRWSLARVVRPSKGSVVVDRESGIAVVASRGAKDSEVLSALSGIPDPIVVFVSDSPPGKKVSTALDKRGAVSLTPSGGVFCVDCVNEPRNVSAKVYTVCAPIQSPVAKPTPTPVAKSKPRKPSKVEAE